MPKPITQFWFTGSEKITLDQNSLSVYYSGMTLKDYLIKRGIRQGDFAAAAGLSKSYMSMLLSGSRLPSLTMANHIQRFTKGAVKASDWEAR